MGFLISANKDALISRTAAHKAVGKALRSHVGRKRMSVKELSNKSGVPDRKIECAMCEPDDPEFRALSLECLYSLAVVLGDEFLTKALAPVRMGAFAIPTDIGFHPAYVAAEDAQDHAELAMCAADGDFRNDGHALRKIGLSEVRRGQRLLALASVA